MPRPTTKSDLLQESSEQFEKIKKLLDSMTEEQQCAVYNFDETFLTKHKEAHWQRDKNLRDVLIHLYEWHQLLLKWVCVNQNGEARSFLPAPYTWKTYGEMNVMFQQKHQSRSYAEAKNMFTKSHNEVMEMIEQFSNEELFEKAQFSWTGNSTLGSYCVSATSSHYTWAIKKIKQFQKHC